MPLATQNDGPFMARLVERIPAIASGRFLSAVALAHPDVIRACHAALGSEAGTDGVPLDYEGLTVGDMRALEADYGKKATLDLRFLERIESGMSQGRRDAAEWRSLYRDIYAQERDIMGQMRSMRYRSERMVRGRGGDFRELLLDEKAWSRFARDELKDELSGLDADTLQFLSKHREDIHGLLSHLGNSDNDTGGLYWYVSALGEKIKDNPGLAGKLQALLVRLNAAYHEKKIREIAGESSRRLSESLDLGSRASGFLERFMSDEKITDPDIAKWSGTPSATTKSVAAGVATKTPEYAKERKTWAGLCGLFEGRVQKHLLAHPAAPGERPGAVFERALDAAFADTGDLDPQTVASLRRAVTEEYWHRYGQTMLASPVMTDAMTGRVTREEFVRRAETVADLATRHYAAGLSAEESLAAIASPEYLSAARALAPQVSAAPAAGTSSLGYPVAADGSLVVESALRGAAYSLDPVTGRISSPEGLSLSVRPDADRESVERAVSSLDFLRESGMSFLGSDVERVFALAHSLDPASSLTPEDGLDESERRLLLSALLPFFGVELPEGAIYTDMTAALDRLNRGTSDRESGLLLRLAGQGAPYIDSDTLAFDFRRFETAFVARSREKQERFDSPAVSI